MVGDVPRRMHRLDVPAVALDDVAVVELDVGREGEVAELSSGLSPAGGRGCGPKE